MNCISLCFRVLVLSDFVGDGVGSEFDMAYDRSIFSSDQSAIKVLFPLGSDGVGEGPDGPPEKG